MKTRNTSLTVTALVLMLMLGSMVVTPSQNLRAQDDPVLLYGWVYDDMNENGVWEMALESGLDDVQVDLHDVSSLDPVSHLTDGGGYFWFEITQPSYYKVTIDSYHDTDLERVFFGTETAIVRVHDEDVDMGRIGLVSREVNSTIRGAVTDGSTGDAVNGATVILRDKVHDFEISELTAPIHEYENRKDKWLISQPRDLPVSSDLKLQFKHWYKMENERDGGNIQISTNGGVSWSVLYPQDGYPSMSVVEGQPGYTGNSYGWRSVVANLNSFSGDTVQIAFRFVSDATVTEEGWYIDDIKVTDLGVPFWDDNVESGNFRNWQFKPPSEEWSISDYRAYPSTPGHSWYCGLDIQGWYSISSYDGDYEIEVTHPGYSPTFQMVTVSPDNVIGNLKNTNIDPLSEMIYLNGNPLTQGVDYSIDYASGVVNLFFSVEDTDEITADYDYTVLVADETLEFGALGGEPGAPLVGSNIESPSFELRRNGALFPGYVLDNVSGYVTYGSSLLPGDVVWANYTYNGGNNVVVGEILTNTSTLNWPPVGGSLRVWIGGAETGFFVHNANGDVWYTQTVYYDDMVNASYDALLTVSGENVLLSGGTRADLELFKYQVKGIARKADGGSGIIDRPIHVALYNVNDNRVHTNTISNGPGFHIGAYPGDFYAVVRIDGYKTRTIPSVSVIDSTVTVSDQFFEISEEERIYTNVTFANDDWNTINVETNWLVNSESYLSGLDYSELHNVRMQIDVALGNGDGVVDSLEIAAFESWLEAKGPRHVVTDKFFLVEDGEMVSDHDTYAVSALTLSPGPVEGTESFWVTTTTDYNTSGIEAGLDEYKLTQFVEYDTSVMGEVEKNRTYRISLPEQSGCKYELVDNSTVSGIKVAGFLTVRIDPPMGTGGPVRVDMTVACSVGGIAKIEVIDPLDRVSIHPDVTYKDYYATLPANLNITFSAATSIDNSTSTKFVSPHANFTWVFDMSNPGQSMRYGIEPVYNYTSGGNYSISLTISESGLDPGGNVSYREAYMLVDELDPDAVISLNITAIDTHIPNANGENVNVNESMAIKFNSEQSTDKMYGTVDGTVEDWRWDVESDGIWDQFVESFTHTYVQPGDYTATLSVADSVGHWSANVSVDFVVSDVSAPQARIMMLNETLFPVTKAIENKTFWFNASDTVDNYDDTVNLTFEWDFGDGTVVPAQVGNFNVSHVFTRIDTYNVTLNVTDTSGNAGNTTLTVKVDADASSRPDLEILEDTYYTEPESIEEGQRIRISVNITNKQNHATAENILVTLYRVSRDDEKEIRATVKYFNESGEIPASLLKIVAGEEVRVELSWTPSTVGKLTILIKVSDANEHSEQIGPDNRMTEFVTVEQAPWKTYLVYIVLIVVIILVVIVIWLRRKWQRGELKFTRKEKAEPKEKKEKKTKK